MDNNEKNFISKFSKKEKIFFSKFAQLNQKNNSTTNQLYKHIQKHSIIDKELLKKESNNEYLIKYLSVEKERLLDKLIFSSVVFNLENESNWKIQRDILFIKVLIDKGLTEKAERLIKRIKKTAYLYEEFEFLILIINLEINLCYRNSFIYDYNRLKKLINERKKANEIIDNINYLSLIRSELQQYQFDESIMYFNNEHFTKIYGHSSIIQEEQILCKKSRKIWLYINIIIYFMQSNYPFFFKYNRQLYEFYHKNQNFFNKSEYLQIINNYLYSCALTKDEITFHTLIEEYLGIKNNTKQEKFYITQSQYLRTLELYHQLEKYKEAEILANEAENFLKNIKYLDNTYLVKYIQLLIIRAYIENKNFNAAILISQIKYKTRGYELNSSIFKLFEFIAHYKLENFDNLLYSVNSWTKTISSKRKQFPIEIVLIKFFRLIYNKVTIQEKKKLISNTIIQLKELEKSNMKFFIKHYFDFTLWFEKELEEMNNNY